jgi:hypothetical protein
VKRRNKKRKTRITKESSQELVQMWNKKHLNEEVFVEEVVNYLGEFVDENK